MTEPPRSPRFGTDELYEAIETGHRLLAQSADAVDRAQATLDDARRTLARANAVRALATLPAQHAPQPSPSKATRCAGSG